MYAGANEADHYSRVIVNQNRVGSAATGEVVESDEGIRNTKIKRPSSSNVRATKRAPNVG